MPAAFELRLSVLPEDIHSLTKGGPIILFDAECVLCSANARFVLEHDEAGRFRLASMQGDVGASLYRRHGIAAENPDTIIIVEGETLRRDSDAVLGIYENLGFPWRLMSIFRVIPTPIRDVAYRWIASNRYRLFGRRECCWAAPPQYRSRIL